MLTILLLLAVSARGSVNLIQRGDFEYYSTMPMTYDSGVYNGYLFQESYILIPSNTSCWYDKAMGLVEILKVFNPITTTCVDMASSIPMTLCQNIALVPRSKYTLTFDIFSYITCQNMSAKAYLNDFF